MKERAYWTSPHSMPWTHAVGCTVQYGTVHRLDAEILNPRPLSMMFCNLLKGLSRPRHLIELRICCGDVSHQRKIFVSYMTGFTPPIPTLSTPSGGISLLEADRPVTAAECDSQC